MLFPQPFIDHLAKPYSCDHKEHNQTMTKYALEAANSALLMALNNSDKRLVTFLSATETAVLDEEQTCHDPIRLAYTFTMILRLWNAPNPYQTSVTARCNLPKTCTWPGKERSYKSPLKLKVQLFLSSPFSKFL